jgi:hypothetical protein
MITLGNFISAYCLYKGQLTRVLTLHVLQLQMSQLLTLPKLRL